MKRLTKIIVFLSLSMFIHLGISHLFAGSTVSRQAYSPVKVSLVSRQTPEKPVVHQEPKPKPRPEPRPKPKPVPEPVPQEPKDVPEEKSEPVIESETPVPQEPSPEVSAIDSQTAALIYENRILDIIRKNLKYPGNARRRGIEGTVFVRFTIQGTGVATDIRIVNSSGAALLDKASLEAIRKCSFPPPSRDSVTLQVPITFRLVGES
jgi:protein TonB